MWRIALLSVLIALLLTTTSRGGEWINDQYGYTINVPPIGIQFRMM